MWDSTGRESLLIVCSQTLIRRWESNYSHISLVGHCANKLSVNCFHLLVSARKVLIKKLPGRGGGGLAGLTFL